MRSSPARLRKKSALCSFFVSIVAGLRALLTWIPNMASFRPDLQLLLHFFYWWWLFVTQLSYLLVMGQWHCLDISMPSAVVLLPLHPVAASSTAAF
jgi:hypothetical protein